MGCIAGRFDANGQNLAKMIDVNLRAPLISDASHCTTRKIQGNVVNIASLAGHVPIQVWRIPPLNLGFEH